MLIINRVRSALATTVAITSLAACSGQVDSRHLVTPSYQTLLSQTAQPRVERFQSCQRAWRDYEHRCRRDLLMWSSTDQRTFCAAFANNNVPDSVLPGFTKSTRRCY